MENKINIEYDEAGNEVIKALDDDGKETGLVLTMSDIYENREIDEIDARTILKADEVESLNNVTPIKQGRKTRLECNNVNITHKETGETWVIKMGNIPILAARIEKDITGSWLILENATTNEQLNVIVPYKKDGTIPDSFPFNVIEQEPNAHT